MFNHLPFTRRRSIRRPGYDYAQPGAYFVTICAFHNRCIFGDVVCDEVQLNAFGEIAREEWFRGAQIRQYLQLLSDEYVVMPKLRRTSKAAVWQDNYYEHVILKGGVLFTF